MSRPETVWFWYGNGMVLVWFWYGFGLVGEVRKVAGWGELILVRSADRKEGGIGAYVVPPYPPDKRVTFARKCLGLNGWRGKAG
jgi:hypothetical protein